MEHKFIITPRTRVSELLDAYPEMERVLMELSPAFEKLKNPVLRKTIARFTTLKHAASIAGIRVEEIVNRLRRETGQQVDDELPEEDLFHQEPAPEWFHEANVVTTFDAGEILDRGEEPVFVVLPALKELPAGGICQVIAPFLPAPLIEKANSLGCKAWVTQEKGKYYVYFSNPLS